MRYVAMITGVVAMLAVAHAAVRHGVSHAEAPRISARALTPGAREVVQLGLARLAPSLVQRMRASDEAHLFVEGEGLSAAGTELVAFIAKARFHGVDVALPDAVTKLGEAAQAPPPEVPARAIEAAWDETAGAPDRLDATARALAKATGYAPRADGEVGRAANDALTAALGTLERELPARPRTIAVLKHPDHGYYLSPDVQWKEREVVTGAPSAEALAAAREGRLHALLEDLAPKHPQYTALVAAAERYAAMCALGPWGELAVPKNDKAAHEPDSVTALQTRLAREGFLSGAATGAWDDATKLAVLEVRRVRHLKDKLPDYDKDLVGALNIPCEARLATLILNVKRWRYTAWTGQHEWVQVNLAGQIVRLFRDDKLVMTQRTVVGSDRSYYSKFFGRRHWRNATPILTDEIETVIVNPEWNVPGRIAREEMGPEIDKDPTYLERNKFRTKVGNDGATYYIQESGPGNALGRIKILFPNSESVYLHDTPGRAKFALPVRALSHGCVRVQNAVEFGAELVRADFEKRGLPFEAKSISDIVASSHRQRVFDLTNKIPVFLEYYTASVDEDGAVWFHPDVYGYDAELFDPGLVFDPTRRVR